MSTCNQLNVQILGSQVMILPKNSLIIALHMIVSVTYYSGLRNAISIYCIFHIL
jgi:hypothetical protein